MFLNLMFKKWFLDNFGTDNGWNEHTLVDAMRRFEDYTKREFDEDTTEVFLLVPGLEDKLLRGVRRQKLTIPAETICEIFEPVISTITTLVSAEIRSAKVVVKAVFLVGGFGQSNYLRS
jgi:hypothetical protein